MFAENTEGSYEKTGRRKIFWNHHEYSMISSQNLFGRNVFLADRVKMRTLMRKWLGLCFLLFFFYVLIYKQLAEEELVEGWNYNSSRDISQYIVSPNLTSILMPKRFCELPSFLLVIVCSAPAHFEARSAIRDSWGSENNVSSYGNMSVYFLLGETNNNTMQEAILAESEIHGDIIQERFIDSYNNLTLKTVMMVKLVTTYCVNSVKFLLKIDDDMFVHMPPLMKMLKARVDPSNILIGSLICGAKPIKDSNNKWYAPNYMYPGRIYPNYLSGTGYLMSTDVVPKLYNAALETPIFHLEDVYITGICTQLIDVKPQNHPGFTYQVKKFEPCFFKDIFTMHKLSPQEILDLYYLVKGMDLNEMCAQTLEQRKGTKVLGKTWFLTNAVANIKKRMQQKDSCL